MLTGVLRSEGISVRSVSREDLELICRHRESMFRASNKPGRSEEILSEMTSNFRSWLEPRLYNGSYFGFVAEAHGVPIGGIGLLEIDWPPHPEHPTEDKRGYVLNVFVEPEHRRRGLSRELMKMAETEFKRRRISFLVLHATQVGKFVYDGMGWSVSSEMTKSIA